MSLGYADRLKKRSAKQLGGQLGAEEFFDGIQEVCMRVKVVEELQPAHPVVLFLHLYNQVEDKMQKVADMVRCPEWRESHRSFFRYLPFKDINAYYYIAQISKEGARVFAMTGAGISTSTGIPDFRYQAVVSSPDCSIQPPTDRCYHPH